MNFILHERQQKPVAEITSVDQTIKGARDFLDMVVNIPSRSLILKQEMFDAAFFDLKTGTAGEILQKVSNYHMQLAIVGDFTKITSKSMRAFIYESNKTNQVLFVDALKAALDRMDM